MFRGSRGFARQLLEFAALDWAVSCVLADMEYSSMKRTFLTLTFALASIPFVYAQSSTGGSTNPSNSTTNSAQTSSGANGNSSAYNNGNSGTNTGSANTNNGNSQSSGAANNGNGNNVNGTTTAGSANGTQNQLPRTASPYPAIGLIGFLSLGASLAVRRVRAFLS